MTRSSFPAEYLERMHSTAVIAVLILEDARAAVPLARALVAGGVDVMELTLRTPAALDALRAIRREVPEMLAGVGTVLTPEQVQEAVSCGAAFGVAPGTNPRVVRAAQQAGLPFAPGVVTPSDVEIALELNCRELKFFPAEPSGGIGYLKTIAAPFQHLSVRFVPLGGISLANLETYLVEPSVLAVGGSWLAPQSLIEQQNWSEIERQARMVRDVVQRLRGGK